MSTSLVSRDTVTSAVAALGKWMSGRSAASKPQLLLDDRDDFIILLLSLRRVPSKGRTNPFFLSVPHPIFPLSDPSFTPSVFLIIDDRAADSPPASKFLEEAKECNLPISEVTGISTLRTDYRPFESRRKLCGSHDLFLADKKILPLLPRLLGKAFFQKKKIPLPVNFSRVGWKDQIKRILNSTFFYFRQGTCSGIRVGRLSMKVEQIVDNVMSVIDEAVEKIPKKWGNVRSFHLKAVDSVALPIYQAVPEIGLKIEVGERENSGDKEVLNGVKAVEEKSEKKKNKKTKKKGGIRYMDEVALVGEELVDEDGDEEGEKETNKKRKKRSKEGTGGEDSVLTVESKTKKKKETGGEPNHDELEVKTKKKKEVTGSVKKKNETGVEPNNDELEVKTKKKKEVTGSEFNVKPKKKKMVNTGGESNTPEMAVKSKKKKKQENCKVEEVECAKAKKKKKEKVG